MRNRGVGTTSHQHFQKHTCTVLSPCSSALPQADRFELVAENVTNKALPSAKGAPAIVSSTAQLPLKVSGCIRRWPPRHLLYATLAAMGDKNMSDGQANMKRKFCFLFQEEAEQKWAELVGPNFAFPDRFAVARAQINLDLACCAHARDRNSLPEITYRQLNIDASPKLGLELLAIREFLLRPGQEELQSRVWPLQCIGYGHSTAIDKLGAVGNSLWLEAGPTAESMRNLCHAVVGVLTDAGVEQSLGDMPDIIDPLLSGTLGDEPLSGWLFPNAMRLLDWNHIWDWLTKVAVENLVFWERFLQLTKALARYLKTTSYKQSLLWALRDSEVPEDEVQALRSYKTQFAKWRFGTLHGVCKELLQAKVALLQAWPLAAPVAAYEPEVKKRVQEAIESQEYWLWLENVHTMTSYTERQRQWGLGCACHEQQCQEAHRRGGVFKCSRKSMRGPDIHGFLARSKLEFDRVINEVMTLPAMEHHPALAQNLREVTDLLFANMDAKLGFSSQMPWLLWRLRAEPEVAQQLLRDFQAHERQQELGLRSRVHRLLLKFCGRDSALRLHVEVCRQEPLLCWCGCFCPILKLEWGL